MKKAGLYVSIEFNHQWNPETDYRLIPHAAELRSVSKPFSEEY
ncbi:hypothetical protein [Cohnella mopanensis]|nr:hypothetical protein [Cohnella mopanensis]